MKPVLIIGSGIGGLTLAHGLRRAKIPFRVYERDASHSARAQGYRIRIHGPALDNLERLLPEDVYRGFVDSCGRSGGSARPGMGRLNARTGETIKGNVGPVGTGRPPPSGLASPAQGPPSTGQGRPPDFGRSLPADRQTMRTCFLQELPEPHYDKTFTHFSTTSQGITAHFKDGSTSVEGSLLVGADGIHSKVTQQLIGNEAGALDTGGRMIFGKTLLTSTMTDTLLPQLKEGMHIIEDNEEDGWRRLMFMEVMRFDHPHSPPDYIYWVILGDSESFGIPDDELFLMSGKSASELTTRIAASWVPGIWTILENQVTDSTAILRTTTANPRSLPTWRTDPRVTVLGDAIHCMPPTGGSGANTAIRDAGLLSDTLARDFEQAQRDGWTSATIEGYEKEMRDYGQEMVKASYGAAVKAFGVRPMDGFPV